MDCKELAGWTVGSYTDCTVMWGERLVALWRVTLGSYTGWSMELHWLDYGELHWVNCEELTWLDCEEISWLDYGELH